MKRIFVVLMLLVVILSGAYFVMNLNTGKPGVPPTQQEQAIKNEKEVTLYYANAKYVETADESLDKVLPVKKKISIGSESIYVIILNQLKNDPEGVAGLKTQIPKNAKLLGVEIKEGIAYVDYSSEGLNGGSLQEMLAISQIVKTLTGMEGIKGVQFLVDGSKTDMFMGHADVTKPFYKMIEIKPTELDISGMKLNVKRMDFIKAYGKPAKATLSKNKRKELLEYTDFKVTISNGITYEISTTSDKKQTPAGVKVGDEKQKVIEIYGEASSVTGSADGATEKYTYQVGMEGLLDIEITNGKVSRIGIRKFE
ncbi:MAG: GerMN domain-containing protein [Deltaproteobacteria bacterium]